MNCLTCARSGSPRLQSRCRPYSTGLCLDLVAETASFRRPGPFDLSCGQRTWARPKSTAQGRRPPGVFSRPTADTTKSPGGPQATPEAPAEGRLMNQTPTPTTRADAPIVTEDRRPKTGARSRTIARRTRPRVAATGKGGRTPST